MTIFGLNSPELFVLLVITLVILGTKRIEKGLDLFSKLLKFLLSNQNSFDKKDKKKEPTKEIESKEKEDEITKIEETINAKEKEITKEKETQKKENKSEKILKIANVDNKENKSANKKDSKGIMKNKTVKKLKTRNPKRRVKDNIDTKSKTINVQKDQLEE